ncbi:MAG: hypothetical protein HY923_04930 [Elusimicrobia bacterium]|nr:hypothetical protein [Elusimicrobiota bacterium]
MRPRLLLAAAALLTAAAAAATTITVLVQQAPLRKRAQSYAPVVKTASLGDKFESSGLESGFYKTESGYIHASAVTARKVSLGSSDSVGSAATAEEMTLAGKGFNAQVEKSYADKNGSANFSAVNAMERRSVSDSALLEFLSAGGLIPGGAK